MPSLSRVQKTQRRDRCYPRTLNRGQEAQRENQQHHQEQQGQDSPSCCASSKSSLWCLMPLPPRSPLPPAWPPAWPPVAPNMAPLQTPPIDLLGDTAISSVRPHPPWVNHPSAEMAQIQPLAAPTSPVCITCYKLNECTPKPTLLPDPSSSMFAILVVGARHVGATLDSFPLSQTSHSLRPIIPHLPNSSLLLLSIASPRIPTLSNLGNYWNGFPTSLPSSSDTSFQFELLAYQLNIRRILTGQKKI